MNLVVGLLLAKLEACALMLYVYPHFFWSISNLGKNFD
jgi:hypothetical protein